MDVIWLKRDVRLQDHAPFAEVAKSKNPFLILYLFEPDQLADPTVHGSHLKFIHEGLVDLERRLRDRPENDTATTFQCLTICHNTMIATLELIHEHHHRIGRVLAHEETGHWQSFMRDKAVRKWCRSKNIPFLEFNQTGVTRCLKARDDYLKKFKYFISKPRHTTPNVFELQKRLVVLSDLPGSMFSLELDMGAFTEVPIENRVDRSERQQQGGETKAMATVESFLQDRGSRFAQGISSPNTSWTSCSRLSPYLSWGHISLRYVVHALETRREQVRQMKEQGRNTGTWMRSLQAFSSRLHWRSHFLQKLESEPEMEKRDLCPSYQPLRREEGDWNEDYYQAWKSGNTGFPFVDACMRCLLQHGWLNFRMRAMLVSFATYNLWLDWKRIAPHMARVFLDYEPGIHYPQLQMQAGTTGINAMRVYNVTKQGKDQDPQGSFIRRYVPELAKVPIEHIHEPWKMVISLQRKYKTLIAISPSKVESDENDLSCYPEPIVNEQKSAKLAKAKVAAVRKLDSTKTIAGQVYQKHGSRNHRRDEMNGRKPKALSTIVEKENPSKQPKISSMFASRTKSAENGSNSESKSTDIDHVQKKVTNAQPQPTTKRLLSTSNNAERVEKRPRLSATKDANSWSCTACTFLNDKPLGLACGMCGTPRTN
jgi:deoxyribodipyrimidine photo-lyase